jgi:hypothetical protein
MKKINRNIQKYVIPNISEAERRAYEALLAQNAELHAERCAERTLLYFQGKMSESDRADYLKLVETDAVQRAEHLVWGSVAANPLGAMPPPSDEAMIVVSGLHKAQLAQRFWLRVKWIAAIIVPLMAVVTFWFFETKKTEKVPPLIVPNKEITPAPLPLNAPAPKNIVPSAPIATPNTPTKYNAPIAEKTIQQPEEEATNKMEYDALLRQTELLTAAIKKAESLLRQKDILLAEIDAIEKATDRLQDSIGRECALAIARGEGTKQSGSNSLAVGSNNENNGSNATVIGGNNWNNIMEVEQKKKDSFIVKKNIQIRENKINSLRKQIQEKDNDILLLEQNIQKLADLKYPLQQKQDSSRAELAYCRAYNKKGK